MSHFPNMSELSEIRSRLLGPEVGYYRLAIFFTAIISLLLLAVPISIQMLIDQVANTALFQPVVVLALTLFALLLISGGFYAAREYVLELFERQLYARLTGEISLKIMAAPAEYFDSTRRDDLMNRYFDIMTVKAVVPHLLVGGFTFLFQSAIGFVVTSLYHPALLMFNVGLITAITLIWLFWGWRATRTSFYVSEAKYAGAAWVEDLARRVSFFQQPNQIGPALERSNALIATHLNAMKNHFKLTFRQLLAFLLLYAAASAALLGIGGWLVIHGTLTLGQLVAAELILSAIFASFAPLAGLLKDYYRLAAALEELDRLGRIPSAADQTDEVAA